MALIRQFMVSLFQSLCVLGGFNLACWGCVSEMIVLIYCRFITEMSFQVSELVAVASLLVSHEEYGRCALVISV